MNYFQKSSFELSTVGESLKETQIFVLRIQFDNLSGYRGQEKIKESGNKLSSPHSYLSFYEC